MDDLIFNELSVEPYSASFEELNQRVKNLVLLCKQAREKFNFKKLRFTRQLHEYKLLIRTNLGQPKNTDSSSKGRL